MSNQEKRKELEAVTQAILSRFKPGHEVSRTARGWLLLWALLPDIGIAEAYKQIMPKLREIEALSKPRPTA